MSSSGPVCTSRVPRAMAAVVALILALGSCGDTPAEPTEPEGPEEPEVGIPPKLPVLDFVPGELSLEPVASGLDFPLHLTSPPGDDRLFVVERFGRIRIVQGGQVLAMPFLDVSAKISTDGSERGLLSLAFHPEYAANGFLYVMYTATAGDVTVERYTVSATNANVADPATAKPLLSVPHPLLTHNGGLVSFGADGMMYIGLGDGGGRGDPQKNARNLGVFLGKLLRIDVDAGDPYGIPDDNPYVGHQTALPEIWASGLRNPWRYAFAGSGESTRLYVADVGMDDWEEINVVNASEAGLDFGWSTTEGANCFRGEECVIEGITFPIHEYGHEPPCTSITGGYEYEGTSYPEHTGRYFFADYCLGWLRSIRYENGEASEPIEWTASSLGRVTSFGRGSDGELYLLLEGGTVARIGGQIAANGNSR